MSITHKRFIEAFAAGSMLLVWGCGGGDYGGSGTPPSSSCTASIASNHGHVLSIAVGDLDSPTAKTYDIMGSNTTHTHSVTFSPAQLQQLEAGIAVTVTSSAAATDGHTHAVSATCFIY